MARFIDQVKALWSKESPDGRLSNRAKLNLAFPLMPSSISNVLIHNAYIKYYSDIIGLDVRFVGIIYLVFGIWNAVNDPMLGVFIDRFRYTEKRGKYVYFMRVTAPLIVLSSFGMLFAQPSWNEWVIFGVFLALLFIFDTAQTAYGIALSSYILVAAPSKDERVDVSVLVTYIANIGGFFGTIIPTLLLVGENNKQLTILLFGGVLLLNSVLYFLAVRSLKDKAEMYQRDVESSEGALGRFIGAGIKEAFTSRAFLMYVLFQVLGRGPMMFYFTPFLYLMDHVFQFNGGQATFIDVSSGLVMFVAAPFLGRLIKKIGTKNSILVSSIPSALAFLALVFAQNFWQVMLAYWAIISFQQVGSLAGSPMMGAIIDEDEQKSGARKAGLFLGLNALITIPISGIQASIFTALISNYGFVSGGGEQTARAMQGIRIGAGLIPFVFILLGMLPMFFSPITLKKEHALSAFSEERHRLLNGQAQPAQAAEG
ncbi:MAG: MFS transporter [Anaerolineae bacterium]|jgi:GPH family glycoside/pentoside/hexuronide:cation symporter|nr:MFS transporter [Anaerolineae bacterium]